MNTSDGQEGEKKPRTRREKWRHAFAMGGEYEERVTKEDEEVIDAFARAIVKRGMAAPALLWFVSLKPLNFIGTSLLQAGEFLFKDLPLEIFIRRHFISSFEHGTFVKTLEKRKCIDRLVELIEQYDEKARDEIRKARRARKKEKAKTKEGPKL
jgi:hypothetical protein